VWEYLDLFWECKRNSQQLKDAEVYFNCALKAAEAPRYQWSRRYVYCFLHCGSMMGLLHFDQSGLVASKALDIEKGTVKFIWCLLGAFRHEPSRLGYPAGKEAPFHRHDSDNELHQVVTVGGPQLYIDDQEAGPPRDHLVSRATVTFQANSSTLKQGKRQAGTGIARVAGLKSFGNTKGIVLRDSRVAYRVWAPVKAATQPGGPLTGAQEARTSVGILKLAEQQRCSVMILS
jgi:hypothetical protein